MLTVMNVVLGVISLMVGSILGYLARRSIAKKQANSLELKLEKKVKEAQDKGDALLSKARKKAKETLDGAEKDSLDSKRELLKKEKFLRTKEEKLDQRSDKISEVEGKIREKVEDLKRDQEEVKTDRVRAREVLETASKMSKEEAKEHLIKEIESEYESDLLERLRRLEQDGENRLEARSKEILSAVIQRYALPHTQEITTTTVHIPNDDIKGKIIGKGGRNIKVLEELTGTEIVVDDTPETVMISGFNPTRRHVAKRALMSLIKDGRIQPSRIEDEVKKAEEEVKKEVKQAGEQAAFQTKVLGLDDNLVQLLGRLHFRTSYGQNVLLHSIEVAELAGAMADEIGVDRNLAKRAGLLHDVGKSVDREVEGSHVDIGMKILEKYGESKDVINAMKSHHGDYEPESIEATIVQTADQISGARPGARKDSLDDYLRRMGDLEKMATEHKSVKEAYAIQAGRELRVFVDPERINDLDARRLAKDIAGNIERELKYPGKIKVTVIREQRVIEYAK